MAESYTLGLMKQGYRTARKYLGYDDEQKKKQAGQTGPAAANKPTNAIVIPGKSRAQISSEEASANKGTENMTPEFKRPRRSILQNVKDRSLDRGATEEQRDPVSGQPTGKRKKKGFGLGVVAKGMLGGM